MTRLLFYKYSNLNYLESVTCKVDESNLVVFKPNIFNLKLHNDTKLKYIYWFFMTLGNYKIVYCKKNDVYMHYSIVLPKFFKFPFMSRNDIEIGPCVTYKKFRGKNIYPYVLNYIIKTFRKEERNIFIMTSENNIPSQKGILKAGFSLYAFGGKKGILKKYTIEEKVI